MLFIAFPWRSRRLPVAGLLGSNATLATEDLALMAMNVSNTHRIRINAALRRIALGRRSTADAAHRTCIARVAEVQPITYNVASLAFSVRRARQYDMLRVRSMMSVRFHGFAAHFQLRQNTTGCMAETSARRVAS
ncbi:hypothetical protein WMF37_49795 [Sorangium sp. So ce291]|uniref:hypothetical protein n=1 Tax=Sorangium sp. So ce291 TaxID=3133294 RepID=UPI003F610AE7